MSPARPARSRSLARPPAAAGPVPHTPTHADANADDYGLGPGCRGGGLGCHSCCSADNIGCR